MKDTVDFLIAQASLTCRPLLYKLFRLACLCLDEPFENLPVVTFGSVNTEDPTCSRVEVMLRVQPYFRNVSRGMETVTSEQSISKFLLLEPDFGTQGLTDVYRPWLSVDYFERTRFLSSWTPRVHFNAHPLWTLRQMFLETARPRKRSMGHKKKENYTVAK